MPHSGACALEVTRFVLIEDVLQLGRLAYSKVGVQIGRIEVLLGDGLLQIVTWKEEITNMFVRI